MFKSGYRINAEGSFEKTENRMVRTLAVSHVLRKDIGVGSDHGFEKTTLKDSNLM